MTLFEKENEQTSHIINETNYIEHLLKQIIAEYVIPKLNRKEFLKNILLNNSIINLNGKIKILLNICADINYKVDKNALIRISQIRNAFAHNYPLAPSSTQITNKGKNGIKVKVNLILESV